MNTRRKLYDIIEVSTTNNTASRCYDIFMIISIVASLIPLTIKNPSLFFRILENITTVIFIIDYILRWITSDLKLKKSKLSFLLYPFTSMAIIDILSILPSIIVANQALRVFKIIRLIRALRVLKIFKSFRYSKNIAMIATVFHKQKKSLITVGVLAIGYILISALVIFNVEPDTFTTFFDAIYWATVSLTTVGYGDIYTTSVIGKTITMISAILGIAIVALPAGIVTAGYMKEIEDQSNMEQ